MIPHPEHPSQYQEEPGPGFLRDNWAVLVTLIGLVVILGSLIHATDYPDESTTVTTTFWEQPVLQTEEGT